MLLSMQLQACAQVKKARPIYYRATKLTAIRHGLVIITGVLSLPVHPASSPGAFYKSVETCD